MHRLLLFIDQEIAPHFDWFTIVVILVSCGLAYLLMKSYRINAEKIIEEKRAELEKCEEEKRAIDCSSNPAVNTEHPEAHHHTEAHHADDTSRET